MTGSLYRILRDVLHAMFISYDDTPPVYLDEIEGVIEVEFEDGHEVTLPVYNLLEEYIKLRLMWHSTSDMFELIPYINEGFVYRLKIDN